MFLLILSYKINNIDNKSIHLYFMNIMMIKMIIVCIIYNNL